MGGGDRQFKAKRKEWGKAQRQAGKCITRPETKPPSGEGTDLEAWGSAAGEEVGRALYSLQRFGVFSVGSEKRQRFLGHVCPDRSKGANSVLCSWGTSVIFRAVV